jgi:hypothetical protein
MTAAAATGNDLFVARSTITGTNGTLTVSLLGSTLGADDTQVPGGLQRGGSGSLWYSWTAPASVRFLLVGTLTEAVRVDLVADGPGAAVTEPDYPFPRCADVEAFCRVFGIVPGAQYAMRVTSVPPVLVSSPVRVNWATSQ